MTQFARIVTALALAGAVLTGCDIASEPRAQRAAVSGTDRLIEYIPFVDDDVFAREELNRAREAARPGEGTRRRSLGYEDRVFFARTLVGECGRCGRDELEGIAWVVLNRLRSGRWGHSVSDVVLYSHGRVWAFSTWSPRQNLNEAAGDHVMTSQPYRVALGVVDSVWQRHGLSDDPTGSASYYYHPTSMKPYGRVPKWAKGKPFVQIGGARFIR